jgi:hypothetical protein
MVVIISMIRSQRFHAIIGPRNTNIKEFTFKTKDHNLIKESLHANNKKMQTNRLCGDDTLSTQRTGKLQLPIFGIDDSTNKITRSIIHQARVPIAQV